MTISTTDRPRREYTKERKMCNIFVRVTDSEYLAIKKTSLSLELSISDMVRSSLNNRFDIPINPLGTYTRF